MANPFTIGHQLIASASSAHSSVPGTVITPHACRSFAPGVQRPLGTSKAFVFSGNTMGSFDTHNAAFLLTDTNDNNDCDEDLLSTSNVGTWHPIVGVFSKDLMDMGDDPTIVYIDGEKCGTGN